jgi:hypothetical protein
MIYFQIYLAMLQACFPPTPEERRSRFRVIDGGRAA